jgi:hypothetical protein
MLRCIVLSVAQLLANFLTKSKDQGMELTGRMKKHVSVFRYAFWLMVACHLYPAEPDGAVRTVMRSLVSDINGVRVIKRVAVDPELDLVMVIGGTKDWPFGQGNFAWWGDHRILGILLQRRNPPDLIYKIAISKGTGDCEVRVERATARDVVLSCTPEKGPGGANYKFVYDIRSKALVKEIDYERVPLPRMFVSGEEALLVGSDIRRLIAVKYSPADNPAFHLLKGGQAEQWTQPVETNIGRIGPGEILGPNVQLYLAPKRFKPARFGPG